MKSKTRARRNHKRIEWRDSLLSKYEEKIRRLKFLLRLSSHYSPNPLKKEIDEEILK